MAAQTPAHRQISDAHDACHLIDAPMTSRAIDPGLHVNAVVEVDEVRNIVNAFPPDRLIGLPAPAHGFELRAIEPHLAVAAHAQLRGRNTGMCRALGAAVAVQAIDRVVTNVMAMVELDWLLDRRAAVRRVRRPDVQHRRDHERDHDDADRDQDDPISCVR